MCITVRHSCWTLNLDTRVKVTPQTTFRCLLVTIFEIDVVFTCIDSRKTLCEMLSFYSLEMARASFHKSVCFLLHLTHFHTSQTFIDFSCKKIPAFPTKGSYFGLLHSLFLSPPPPFFFKAVRGQPAGGAGRGKSLLCCSYFRRILQTRHCTCR